MYRSDLIESQMKSQGFTDESLAAKTGLTRQKIGELRTGKAKDPKLSTFIAIANGLGLALHQLFRQKAA
jgi:transcriptional regulator with XRE-family HTH domain